MATVTVNAVGDQCPIPVVKTIKAMGRMTEAGVVETFVDNEIAVQNLTKLAKGKGLAVSSEKLEEKRFVVRITVEDPSAVSTDTGDVSCQLDARKNTVAVFDANVMGRGDDALGETLMKGFIYTLSQLDELPSAMLFYNGGAKLTVEGSVSLEDLKSMEAQGVEILTCGTCLNFYGLGDKLAVGSVTNMYAIVEKLNGADKLIRP